MKKETPDNTDPELSVQPIVLLLLDGWGVAPKTENNLFSLVDIDSFSSLSKDYPVTILNSGEKEIESRYLRLGCGIEGLSGSEDKESLTEIIAKHNLKQIKIAETERFVVATYCFNGGKEERVIGEEQIVVSSGVEFPVKDICQKTLEAIKSQKYNFILAVIADIDLVTKTGDTEKAKACIEMVDDSIRKITNEVLDRDGVVVISAAGGRAEKIDRLNRGSLDTELADSPVPVIIVGKEYKDKNVGLLDPPENDLSLLSPVGNLADIAPTILHLLGIEISKKMTGKSLIT